MKTLSFYTLVCCLFGLSMTAQQNDIPGGEISFIGSSTLEWASKYNNIGLAYAKNGKFKKAHAAFIEYEERFPEEGMAYCNWAVYYAMQNENEKALMYLQRAVALGFNDLKWLKTDDSMDGLRREKAFIEILKKLEIPEKK